MSITQNPTDVLNKTFSQPTGQSLKFAYDRGTNLYGYVYVPGGILNKFRPSQYAGGALLALPSGPSVTLNLAGNSSGEWNWSGSLAEQQLFYAATPVGTFDATAGINASIGVKIGLPQGVTSNDNLSAHAYYTPGFLLSLNTGGESGVRIGSSDYLDLDVSAFLNYTGVTITPTLTPYLTASWGLFTPTTTPIIGKFSVAELKLRYDNPLTLKLQLAQGGNSLTIGSSGNLKYGAYFLPTITEALSYEQKIEIYKVTTGNLL